MLPLHAVAKILLYSILCSAGIRAQNRTEATEATITDPDMECTAYDDPLVDAIISNFPGIWEPAKILANDSAALAMWNNMSSSIPDIPPKGTIAGDFTNSSNYPDDDPDCWWTDTLCTTPKHPGITPDWTNMPEPGTWGYGFDDGPNCSHNLFYDFLQEQNQLATMYFIGSNVMDYPYEAQRALTDGHEICVHTWSHNYMTGFISEDAFAELWYGMQAIKQVVGVTPRCWRPPYGDVDDRIRTIAQALGLQTIIWEYDTNDWEEGSDNVTVTDIDQNYQVILDAANNGTFNSTGTIVLTHEIDNFTMLEAIKMYPKLLASFKHLVPVGVGYNITQPYVETNYTLPSFAEYIAARSPSSNTTNTTSTQSTSPATSSTVPTNSPVPSIGSQVNTNSAVRDRHILQDGVVAATVALIYALLL